MSRSWCWGLLGLAVAAGCLLPEASVDPSLDEPMPPPDTKVGSALGGSGGAGGSTISVVTAAGAGGAAGSSVMPAAGAGGSVAVTEPPVAPPTAGAGGGTGGSGTGAAGAAGAAGAGMRLPMADCSGGSPEEACAAYCLNYTQSCGDYPAAYTYDNITDCTNVCNNSSWPVGDITEKGSILCRCYHATLALNNGVTPHCYHAAEMPSMANGCAP